MRSLVMIAVLIPLLFAVGCAKKTAKKPAADDPPGTTAQPSGAPGAGANKKDGKADEPNWLSDPRFKKEDGPALPVETPPGGKPGWGVGTPPPGGWTAPGAGAPPTPGGVAPNPMGAPPVSGPGAPAIGAAPVPPNPEPVKPPVTTTTTPKYSTVTEADMKEVWVFIENASGASGKMPTQLEIYQALVAASFTSGALVKDGSIYLTGATKRESIWAFETKALTSGGLVCSQNGVETLTAAELKKRLGK